MVRVEERAHQPYFAAIALACLLLLPLLAFEYSRSNKSQNSATPPVVSPEAGHYNHPLVVKLVGNSAESTIYYTLNGSDPRTVGQLYTAPIALNDAGVHVVRAAQQSSTGGWSERAAATYIIKLQTHLPVLSLIADQDGLYSAERGIIRNPNGRGLDWERVAEIQFFEGDRSPQAQQLAFSSPAGVRVHGSASRGYPKVSLRLYFRGQYGNSRLRYPLYAGQQDSALAEFDRLVLHSGSQDYATPQPDPRSNWTLLRGALLYELAAETTAFTTQSRPVLLFINGRSYGIYQLKTMPDETHMQDRYGIGALDMFAMSGRPSSPNEMEVSSATARWDEVLAFIETHDIQDPTVYAEMGEMVNIERLIDYMVLEMYAGNKDWLRNNMRLFRSAETGRWNFLIWDVDQVFGLKPWTSIEVNMIEWLHSHGDDEADTLTISTEGATFERGSLLLRRLLENDEFKQRYLTRLDELLNSVLSAEKVAAQLDTMAAEIRPDITFETNLWTSPGDWETSITEMRDFVLQRPERMRANHQAFFGVVPWEQ